MFLRQAVHRLRHGMSKICDFQHKTEKLILCGESNFGGHRCSNRWKYIQWGFLSGQAVLGAYSLPSLAEDINNGSSFRKEDDVVNSGSLRNVEDSSVISNEHTSKWRIFTDSGRDYFLQGNVEQAEKFFRSALQEAKEGFGERDPHVAAAYNNLAELLRVKRNFDAAEPLYIEAIKILEENYGEDDIRVGAAIDNFGQFYLLRREIEKAYHILIKARFTINVLQRALKIKRRILGEGHTDYAETIYRLGCVLSLQGHVKEAEDLLLESIRILEDSGQGESILCIKRMRHLSQMYIKTKKFADAEILLRKILHMLELSKGWETMDTNIAAEQLAFALQASGKFKEAEELLERCLDALKGLIPDQHIQNAAIMLSIARGKLQIINELIKADTPTAMDELDMAKSLLQTSMRISQKNVDQSSKRKGKKDDIRVLGKSRRDMLSTVLTLLRSLEVLVSLEIIKLKHLGPRQYDPAEVESAIKQCISSYKLTEESTYNHPLVKAEYLSCLHQISELMSLGVKLSSTELTADEIKKEILRIESETSKSRALDTGSVV